jgi:hypothetical protein
MDEAAESLGVLLFNEDDWHLKWRNDSNGEYGGRDNENDWREENGEEMAA